MKFSTKLMLMASAMGLGMGMAASAVQVSAPARSLVSEALHLMLVAKLPTTA